MQTPRILRHNAFGNILIVRHADNLQREQYVHPCADIASDAFGAEMSAAFIQDVRGHLYNHHVAIVTAADTHDPIGFLSSNYFRLQRRGVLYISGLTVKQQYQAKGYGTSLVHAVFADYGSHGNPVDYIAGRTQNPVIVASRRRYCETVYPIDAEPTEEIVSIVHGLRKHLNMNGSFDAKTLVNHDTYESPLFAHRPSPRDSRIRTFFDECVGPRDSVFIIGTPKI